MRSMDETQIKQFTTPIPLDRDIFMRRLITSLGHLNSSCDASSAGTYC
jgi:hypothetical protein